jgi:hypothetical protein
MPLDKSNERRHWRGSILLSMRQITYFSLSLPLSVTVSIVLLYLCVFTSSFCVICHTLHSYFFSKYHFKFHRPLRFVLPKPLLNSKPLLPILRPPNKLPKRLTNSPRPQPPTRGRQPNRSLLKDSPEVLEVTEAAVVAEDTVVATKIGRRNLTADLLLASLLLLYYVLL